MIKTKTKKDKVVTFRLTSKDFATYEKECIRLHVAISDLLREKVYEVIKKEKLS
jgi:hypothetical protein